MKNFLVFTLILLLTNNLIIAQTPGNVDLSFECGWYADNTVTKIVVQSDGKIILAGEFQTFNSTVAHQIVRLNPDLTVDPTFNSGSGFPDCNITDMLVTADNKIVISGDFMSYDGHACSLIVRLNADGSYDPTFNTTALGLFYPPENLTLQPDGKILYSGSYLETPAYLEDMIVRMNTDGSRDSSFSINLGISQTSDIKDMALQSDGKLIIGGLFYGPLGVDSMYNVMRLKTNGAKDNPFIAAVGYAAGAISGNYISKIAIKNDGAILLTGKFTNFNGTPANGIVQLNADGIVDVTFNSGIGFPVGATFNTLSITPENTILVSGGFGSYNGSLTTNTIILNSNGSINKTYLVPFSLQYLSTVIYDIAYLADGTAVAGGPFKTFNDKLRTHFVHLNADRSVEDVDFPLMGIYGGQNVIYDFVITPDQKIIIAGFFDFYDKYPVDNIVRLNADGTIDTTFHVSLESDGVQKYILDINQTPDGKLYIAGEFTKVNGLLRKRIARLNADGTVDLSFAPVGGPNDDVYKIAVSADGKIFIAGFFSSVAGVTRKKIALLNADGSLNLAFDPGSGPNNDIFQKAIFQSDNKIILSGAFTKYNGITKKYLMRLNLDGTIDPTFNITEPPSAIPTDLVLLADDKLLISGMEFYNGTNIHNIARLNADGTIDPTFDFTDGLNGTCYDIDLLADGGYLIAGDFSNIDGTPCYQVALLNSDGTFNDDFIVEFPSPPNYVGVPIAVVAEMQDDGNILVSGSFKSFNGVTRNQFARIYGIPSVCSMPENLFADNITPNKAKIHWDVVPGAETYQIYYRVVGAPGWTKMKAFTNLKNLNGLVPSTNYEYKIRTNCGEGYTEFSPTATFTTLPLKMGSQEIQVEIYPNPTDGKISIELSENTESVITFYDITGRQLNVISDENSNQYTILNYQGLVIIKIACDANVITKQVIVQ